MIIKYINLIADIMHFFMKITHKNFCAMMLIKPTSFVIYFDV